MTDHDSLPAAGRRHSLDELRAFTPARVGLARAGVSMTTRALLDFTLDHARARDAVHAAFDAEALIEVLRSTGMETLDVSSRAVERGEYLRRPDLGRTLSDESRRLLDARDASPCEVVIVIGDGLSPAAINIHVAGLFDAVRAKLAGLSLGPVVVGRGARVALGDEIGALLKARMTVMLIGERPGLSAPHSIGAYLTFAPRPGLTDVDRNCVSNIQPAGLSVIEAAAKVSWLAREGLRRQLTGVALKDESDLQLTASLSAPV